MTNHEKTLDKDAEVKSIKELLDAARMFLDAIPEGHPMAKIVTQYVDAERIAYGDITRGDADYFYATSNAIYNFADELAGYFVGVAVGCEDIPAHTVDSWDGCENG